MTAGTAIQVGIDEVGYGPKLGPLVVCAVAAEVPEPMPDLWAALSDREIPVGDSKRIFSQKRGIGTLEPTALSYLAQVTDLRGLTHASLWRLLSPDPRAAPWYGDLPLPAVTETIPVERLRERLARHRVSVRGVWARILEPAPYNACVGENKSELLFDCAADLVLRIRTALPGPIEVALGKQGSRRCYFPSILRRLGPAEVLEETRERSRYRWNGTTLSYLLDGEDRSFLLALASMIAKYLRELSMVLFNAFWAERVRGLRATAGYGLDARRFFDEIEPHLSRHRIPRSAVLRSR